MRLLPTGARMKGSSSGAPITVVFRSHRGNRDRATRTKRELFERLDVVAERHFRVGAAVDVIEDDARQAALGEPAKVADVEHVRRGDAARHGGILSRPAAVRTRLPATGDDTAVM